MIGKYVWSDWIETDLPCVQRGCPNRIRPLNWAGLDKHTVNVGNYGNEIRKTGHCVQIGLT